MTRLIYGLFTTINNSCLNFGSNHNYNDHKNTVLDNEDIAQRYQLFNRLKISNFALIKMVNLFFLIVKIFLIMLVLFMCSLFIVIFYWHGLTFYDDCYNNQKVTFFFYLFYF